MSRRTVDLDDRGQTKSASADEQRSSANNTFWATPMLANCLKCFVPLLAAACNLRPRKAKIMAKATETGTVVESAANEMLRTSLPLMYTELEKCQKSLEGYLEQKRNKFPRFYFVSNPGGCHIPESGGSVEPLTIDRCRPTESTITSIVRLRSTNCTIPGFPALRVLVLTLKRMSEIFLISLPTRRSPHPCIVRFRQAC